MKVDVCFVFLKFTDSAAQDWPYKGGKDTTESAQTKTNKRFEAKLFMRHYFIIMALQFEHSPYIARISGTSSKTVSFSILHFIFSTYRIKCCFF